MSQYIEVVERYPVPDLPPTDLPFEDGVPLETNWHRLQINLLADSVRHLWPGRTDYFAGGNMFVYYSMRQVRNRDYKGPDFFVVKNVDGLKDRKSWIAWDEDGRLPDVIVELLSSSTAKTDLGEKKDLYEGTFKTQEYFCLDPEDNSLRGWHLMDMKYVPLTADAEGRMWSRELGAWLGPWRGEYLGLTTWWIRFYDSGGSLVPTVAEAETARADAETARADAAEAEVARLREQLQRLKKDD